MTQKAEYDFEIVREIRYGGGNRPANGRGDRLVFERCQTTGAGRVRRLDGENRVAWEENFLPTGKKIRAPRTRGDKPDPEPGQQDDDAAGGQGEQAEQ